MCFPEPLSLPSQSALTTVAKSGELKKLQRTQLSRLTKKEFIDSILTAPDLNEGTRKTLMEEKFQDLTEQVVKLNQLITSPDNSIN